MANTSLVAASAVAAGNDFFDPSGTAVGSVANNQAGDAGHERDRAVRRVGLGFADQGLSARRYHHCRWHDDYISSTPTSLPGPATISTPPATAVATLLSSSIDSITGTSTPSTINGGVVTLNTDNAASLIDHEFEPGRAQRARFRLLSHHGAATAAAGLELRGHRYLAGQRLRRYGGLVHRKFRPVRRAGSSNARIDSWITVQYGAQANEQAIRQQLEGVAVFAAVTVSPTGANSAAQISALSSRIATNMTAQPGQQTIADIQTDFAAAQTIMQEAGARQTQSSDSTAEPHRQTETVSTRSGGEPDSGIAEQPVGVLPDHLDALLD